MILDATDQHIAIIGTGFSGICAAIKLKEAGINDFTIYERATDVGGTWRDNTYPGAGCDVPSVLYSFSFAQNPHWTRQYAPWNEIHGYLRGVVDKYDLMPHIRFGCQVDEIRFDDHTLRWTLELGTGEAVTAHAVISAVGILSQPSIPHFPGQETFQGNTFHSAQWDHDLDLSGKRVAVIGTGASAIQFVPKIAEQVEHLTVFQRSPHWVLPRGDKPVSARTRTWYRRLPILQRFQRWRTYWTFEKLARGFLGKHPRVVANYRDTAVAFINAEVRDPAMRAALTPDYDPGCKRRLVSDDWYPSLQRPNVELVTAAVSEITPNSVISASGAEAHVDTIIYGTGFTATDFLAPMKVFGRRGIELSDAWRDGAATKLGITTHGFPNLFMMYGPNTSLGHNSIVFMIEAQARYIIDAIGRLAAATAFDLDAQAQHDWYQQTQAKMATTVWATGGCSSWYKSADGRIDTLWPEPTPHYWRQTRTFNPDDYTTLHATPVPQHRPANNLSA